VRGRGAGVVGKIKLKNAIQRFLGHDVGRAWLKASYACLAAMPEDVEVAGGDRDIRVPSGPIGERLKSAIA
jgi:hypothetical protein